LLAIWRAAAAKPAHAVYLMKLTARYARHTACSASSECGPDQQVCARRIAASAEGVGAQLARDLAQRQQTCARGVSDEADSSVCPTHRMLSFVRMRPRPTGLCAPHCRFCRRRRSAACSRSGAQRQQPAHAVGLMKLTPRYARHTACSASRASLAPTGLCAPHCRFCRRRRSAACSRSGAQRQPNLRTRCV